MSEENAGGENGQNGALLSDPVDVIIDKLLRYVDVGRCIAPVTRLHKVVIDWAVVSFVLGLCMRLTFDDPMGLAAVGKMISNICIKFLT
jgi:hypothetical protein